MTDERGPSRRICVVGCSGGGKTTMARSLAQRLRLPHLELDSVYHQPGWESLATADFRKKVNAFTSQSEWVVDGNYNSEIGDITWDRADTIVWMHPSQLVATARVARRTFGRLLSRKELWNGNREHWRYALSTDPEKSIIAWAWKMHDKYNESYGSAISDPKWAHLRFVRLSTARDAEAFLEELDSGG